MLRLGLCSLLTAALTVTGLAPAPTLFAVQGHSLLGPPDRHRRTVDLMAALGVSMLRDECHWSRVEQTPGQFALPEGWSDNLDAALAQGIEVLLILNYTNPHFDEGLAPHTDAGRAAFAAYAEFMARETRGRVRHFEIWNEPNTAGFWPPVPDAEDYAALVAVAAEAVRRANPDAVIIGGVSAGIDEPFFRAAFEAGLAAHLDAISIHPYCTPAAPEEADIWDRMAAIRALAAEHGRHLPVWITEFGYPTAGANSVSEDRQADMVARTYLGGLARPWVERVFYYWFGPDGPDRDLNEDNFGLVRHDWSRKPAFDALQTLVRLFAEAEFEQTLDLGPRVEAHVFSIPASGELDTLTALWTWDGVRTVEVGTARPARLALRDGKWLALFPLGESFPLSLSGSPVYLLTSGAPRIPASPRPMAQFELTSFSMTTQETRRVDIWLEADVPVEVAAETSDALEIVPPRGRTDHDEHAAVYTLTLHPRPGAPRGEHLVAATLTHGGQAVGRALVQVTIEDPVTLHLAPAPPSAGEGRRIAIEIESRAPHVLTGAVSGTVSVGASRERLRAEQVSIAPRGSATVNAEIAGSHPPDALFGAEVSFALPDGDRVSAARPIAFLTSPRAAASPEIDGDLSDWRFAGDALRLASEEQVTTQWRPWEGPEDASARLWTAWDGAWFYVAAEVADDALADSVTGHEMYKNDGLEVYFDADLAGDRDDARYSDDDNQFGLFLHRGGTAVWSYSHLNNYSPGARIAANRAPTPPQTISGAACAYTIEAAIPLSELNLAPRDGLVIGFNAALDDDDDPRTVHPFGQDTQLSWSRRRLAWQNPQHFAQLTLIDPAAE